MRAALLIFAVITAGWALLIVGYLVAVYVERWTMRRRGWDVR